jgi:hypothetical protein
MTLKSWKHFFALAATLLAAYVSAVQARRALEKAEYEGGSRQIGASSVWRELLSSLAPRAVGRALGPRNDPDAEGFDVRHFRHVATLWMLIVIGSLLAVLAEGVDFYLEPK